MVADALHHAALLALQQDAAEGADIHHEINSHIDQHADHADRELKGRAADEDVHEAGDDDDQTSDDTKTRKSD